MSYQFPDQPITTDEAGKRRFVANPIVRYLLDNGGISLNDLALIPFPAAAHAQLAQLIGYSVAGYGDLSYVSAMLYQRVNGVTAQRDGESYAAGYAAGAMAVIETLRAALATAAQEIES